MPKLTFWFEFASTYSYLSAMRIAPLAQAAGVSVDWRPFMLGPIFKAQGLTTSPFNVFVQKGRYMWRDMERQTEAAGLPLVRPDPFPQNGLLAARVATLGADTPWGPDFVRGMYDAQFGQGLRLDSAEVVVGVLERLGQDGEAVVARVSEDAEIKGRLRAATEEAEALGIFGAPSFTTTDGELFWGNDRLEAALDWAQRG